MTAFFSRNCAWLYPLLAFALITPFTPFLDLTLARHFYKEGHFSTDAFYLFLFNYGILPAQLLFIGALCIWIGSYIFSKLKQWRWEALALILTLVIGSGLITHVIFKDHWGRPRPKQVIEFGGIQHFRPYFEPNFFHQVEPSKSFPSGHCTMGFYFFSLALIGRRLKNRPLFWISITLAAVLGILLSWARLAQGGHFLSDTLASAVIMWWTAYACDRWTSLMKDGGT
jgi:lipid A 4'-phosphatase